MLDDVISILMNPFFIKAFIGIFISALVAGNIGPILTTRGISFLTAEVAHAVLGGAALGIFIRSFIFPNVDPLIIALLFGILSGLIAAYLGEGGRGRFEAAIGMSLALSMAIAVLFLAIIPSEDIPLVWGYLLGDILFLSLNDIILLSTSTILILIISLLFNREFLYIAFDEDGAKAMGLNTRLYHYISVFISSLGIVVLTKALGSIIIYAILIVPPMMASMLTNSYTRIRVLSFLSVLIYGIIGLYISFLVNVAPSGLIALLLVSTYIIIRLRRG